MTAADVFSEMIVKAAEEGVRRGLASVHTRRLFSVKDAAKYLDCSSRHVYELVAAGKLVATKDGVMKIDIKDLEAYVERAKAAPGVA